MPRELTKAESLQQQIDQHETLCNALRYWATKEYLLKQEGKHRDAVAAADAELAKAQENHADAPGRLVSAQRKLDRLRQEQAGAQNSGKVAKLERMIDQLTPEQLTELLAKISK